jgi:tripartite ATP-independent transporter DctP family solute receptor
MKVSKLASAKVSRRSVLAGGVAASLALTFSVKRAAAAEFEFRLGHPLQPTDATQTAMLSYADAVKERTGGRVEIEVFPADQLGVQKEVGEMLVQGANVMQFTDYLFLAEWVPDAGILQAPFLLNELDDWYKLAKSDWMKSLEAKLQEKNIRVLSNNNYFGSRSIIGPKAIRKPEDIKGETIREAAAPMYIAMAEAWGARPVVMGFAETYTGLSQGVVDFVECPPQAMVSSKFTELRKVVSLTNHMVNWNPVIVSQSSFAALPEDLQQIMIEESFKAGDLVTKLKRESDVKVEGTLKEMGIEVITDIDKAAFQKASLPAYESFKDWTPGLTETVRGILDS